MNFTTILTALLSLLVSKSFTAFFVHSNVRYSVTIAETEGAVPGKLDLTAILTQAMNFVGAQPVVQVFRVGGMVFTATLARA